MPRPAFAAMRRAGTGAGGIDGERRPAASGLDRLAGGPPDRARPAHPRRSWHMPAAGRDARAEYDAAHIPGARFFDIDEISDAQSEPAAHGAAGGEVRGADARHGHRRRPPGRGLRQRRACSAPPGSGGCSGCSARRTWRCSTAACRSGAPRAARSRTRAPILRDRHFTARRNAGLVRDVTQVAASAKLGDAQIVDARSPERFRGEAPEPRPGLRSGHIPGARNVHYRTLLNPDGTMKDPAALRAAFEAAGVDVAEAGHHHLRLGGQRGDPEPGARAARQPQPRALRRVVGGMGRLSRPRRSSGDEAPGRRAGRLRRHLPRDGRPARLSRARTCRPGPAAALIARGARRRPGTSSPSTTRSGATTSGPTSTTGPAPSMRGLPARPGGDALHLHARRLAARLLRARRPRARPLRPRPISGWCRRRSGAASAPSCCRPRCTWPGTGRAPRRVTVNTNSLDHPRALPLYQKAGFVPVRRETRSRVLTRDRDMRRRLTRGGHPCSRP